MDDTRLNVRVPTPLVDEVDREAHRRGFTRSEMVRIIMVAWLDLVRERPAEGTWDGGPS